MNKAMCREECIHMNSFMSGFKKLTYIYPWKDLVFKIIFWKDTQASVREGYLMESSHLLS